MIAALSSPDYLFGGGGADRTEYLATLVDAIGAAVLHQHAGQLNLIQALVLNAPMLRALPHVARPPPPAGSPSATPCRRRRQSRCAGTSRVSSPSCGSLKCSG